MLHSGCPEHFPSRPLHGQLDPSHRTAFGSLLPFLIRSAAFESRSVRRTSCRTVLLQRHSGWSPYRIDPMRRHWHSCPSEKIAGSQQYPPDCGHSMRRHLQWPAERFPSNPYFPLHHHRRNGQRHRSVHRAYSIECPGYRLRKPRAQWRRRQYFPYFRRSAQTDCPPP